MTEEHKTEHKAHEEHKEEHKVEHKHKDNMWRYTTIALMVVVVLLLVVFLWKPGESSSTGTLSVTTLNQISSELNSTGTISTATLNQISSELNCFSGTLPVATQNQIANKTVNFINENIISGGSGTASVDLVSETSGILNVTVLYQGRQIPVYATTNGKYLILPGAGVIDMDVPIPQAEQTAEQPTETPKTDKPVAQLYVMAFCPYGIQAENAMKPVVDLLGNKTDIQIRFIANVGGTTPDTIQSLHGAPEAQEDLRQVCIMKYYSQKTYWNYLMDINANCSGSYSNNATYDPCWKNAATKLGIDVSKIDTCSKGTEGVNLLKADADLSSANGVSGSPTLIINGAKYNGARTPDGYKAGICAAFTTSPTECSQNLSTTASAASGNCG